MEQQNGNAPKTVTSSPGAATGPGADSTTAAVNDVDLRAWTGECHAEVHVRIERKRVVLTGVLHMGGRSVVTKTWERQSGPGRGWISKTPDFIECAEQRLGRELAEYLDGLPFPFDVSNLLPRPATAAGVASRAAACKEVGSV